jgi:hypothetical protein
MSVSNDKGQSREHPISPSGASILEALQKLADVRVGLSITSHRKGPVGPAIVLAKKSFRSAFQIFINELMRKQHQFNETLVKLVRVIYNDINSVDSATLAMRAGLQERMRRMEERMTRLEEATKGTKSATSASSTLTTEKN